MPRSAGQIRPPRPWPSPPTGLPPPDQVLRVSTLPALPSRCVSSAVALAGSPAAAPPRAPHRHEARSPSRTCLLSCPSAYVHLTRKRDLVVPLSDSNGLPRGDGTQTAHRGRQAEPCHAWRSAAAAPFSGRLRSLWVARAKSSSVPSALLLPELFAGIFSLLQLHVPFQFLGNLVLKWTTTCNLSFHFLTPHSLYLHLISPLPLGIYTSSLLKLLFLRSPMNFMLLNPMDAILSLVDFTLIASL